MCPCNKNSGFTLNSFHIYHTAVLTIVLLYCTLLPQQLLIFNWRFVLFDFLSPTSPPPTPDFVFLELLRVFNNTDHFLKIFFPRVLKYHCLWVYHPFNNLLVSFINFLLIRPLNFGISQGFATSLPLSLLMLFLTASSMAVV